MSKNLENFPFNSHASFFSHIIDFLLVYTIKVNYRILFAIITSFFSRSSQSYFFLTDNGPFPSFPSHEMKSINFNVKQSKTCVIINKIYSRVASQLPICFTNPFLLLFFALIFFCIQKDAMEEVFTRKMK